MTAHTPEQIKALLKRINKLHVAANDFVNIRKPVLDEVTSIVIAQSARIRELEAALHPFAEQAAHHSDKMPDEMFIDDYERPKGKWVSLAGIRLRDLRRAARALTERNG